MTKKIVRLALVLALVCTALPMGTQTQAKGPCLCPQIYAPVVCSNGKTYPNQCVANCHHAHDCVPSGVISTLAESTEVPACALGDEPVFEFEATDEGETPVEAPTPVQ